MAKAIGADCRKWWITKSRGKWLVCPPATDQPDWYRLGSAFPTGAEAHAAFARGRR